jgi:hypothetical protein
MRSATFKVQVDVTSLRGEKTFRDVFNLFGLSWLHWCDSFRSTMTLLTGFTMVTYAADLIVLLSAICLVFYLQEMHVAGLCCNSRRIGRFTLVHSLTCSKP